MIDEACKWIIAAQAQAMKEGKLSMWTIYDHPKDFPHSYVARRFSVDADGGRPTGDILQCPDLKTIRMSFSMCGLHCLKRDDQDEPQILETWI